MMRRSVATKLTCAAIGATLCAAASLPSGIPEAKAQTSLLPHWEAQTATVAGTGAAAMVREALLAEGTAERELECLARNVYFEARGEPMTGKYAVASVTLNRVVSPLFPDGICAVVYQGAGQGRRDCQFSWACDRYSDHPRNAPAWELAKQVAYNTLFLDKPDPTEGAHYFHASWVRPNWSRTMVKVGRIGGHIFYRSRGLPPTEVAEADY
jgi:spore germination cell wall hydrolase CwlJ-like protein